MKRSEIVFWLAAFVVGYGASSHRATRSPDPRAGTQQGGGRCFSALEGALENLELDLEAFERLEGDAWHNLAIQGCYAEAGRLIDAYLEREPDLSATERAALEFQAGQMFAVAGDREIAIDRFEDSRLAEDPSGNRVRWNAYVDATLAFLRHDRAMLERQHEIIAAGGEGAGETPHLRAVDVLVDHFGEPYRVAYESIRPKLRNRRRQSE